MTAVSHALHRAIGDFLQQSDLPADCQLLLAPECGGSHNLLLFCSDQKSNDAEYCNVDAMVVKAGKIRFLLETEESGFLPTKIGGKFLTAALSTHFIHDVLRNVATPMDSEVMFIQIVDSTSFQRHSKKILQGQSLERSIRALIPARGICITGYRLFFFRGAQKFETDQAKRDDLRRIFLTACSRVGF